MKSGDKILYFSETDQDYKTGRFLALTEGPCLVFENEHGFIDQMRVGGSKFKVLERDECREVLMDILEADVEDKIALTADLTIRAMKAIQG